MAILVDGNTRLVVQGITGKFGSFHAKQMLAYGTKVVGGVTPGGGGTTFDADPEWQTMRAAAAGQHVRRGGRAAVLRATALPACSRQFDVLGVRCTCNCTMLRPTAPLVGPSPPRIANYW